MSTQGRNNLFPVGCIDSSSRENTTKLDWLENKSFTSQTAEKVVEFQQELKKLQKVGEGEQIKESEASKQGTSKVFPVIDHVDLTYDDKWSGSSSSSSARSSADDSEDEHVMRKRHRDSSSDREHVHKQVKKKKKRKYRSDDSDSGSFKKKKKSKKQKNKKQKKGKHKSREKPKDSHIEIKGIFSSNKIFLDEVADVAPEHPFKLDRVPDNNSWTYGSLYSGHVASYKPACNQCVGTEGSQLVFIKDQIKKEKLPSQRYYSKENRKMVQLLPWETITKQVKDVYTRDRNTSHSFIPVQIESSAVTSVDQDVRQQILDSATSLYVQGKGKTGAEAQSIEEICQDPLRRKVAEYNKQLRECPTDVKLWLQFVKFQDKLSEEENLSKCDSEETGKPLNARGILEKKLSILDKALEANPGNIELLLAKVELNAEISDSFKINKELDQLLFVHPANADLWKYYLTFNQTRLSVFTVTKTTKLYQKCFKTIIGILEGQVQTHTVPQNLERKLLDIFCQYCYFLKQAGYKEKAIASFQALLEFNLFAPPTLNSVAKETKMAAFEEFWESNMARIGMAGAKGWKTWFEQKDKEPTAANTSGNEQTGSLEEQEEAIIEQKHSKHITWLEIESLREQDHWLPWQPGEGQTEDDCEDVERLVLFDDVSSVLFIMNKEDNICHCVHVFLNFLGFHSKWDCFDNYIDTGLIPEYLDDLTSHAKSGNCPNVLKRKESEHVRNVAIETLKLVIPVFSGIERTNLTLTLCNIKLSIYRDKELSKQHKKEMRTIMKSILKEEHCRNNLFIWSAYIDRERIIGKPGEAKAVIETALAMNSGSSVKTVSETSVGLLSLYSQYCDILLEIPQSAPSSLMPRTIQISMETKRKVLSVLGCMVEAEKFKVENLRDPSGAVVLKTLSSLSKMCDFVCKDNVNKGSKELEREYILKVVWCYSLYTYCKSDLKSCLGVYANVIAMFSSSALISQQFMQQLHMDRLRLIVHHMSRTSSPLHILREVLDSTLSSFPDNPVFLSLFLDIERKSRITGRINLHFDRWCRNVGSPSPAVCGVVFQLGLLEEVRLSAEESNLSESGLVHRARGWLEHSLSHSNLQHCPLLWRLYLKLEEMSFNTRRLKGVFYRAMQQCPWAKSVYMDGVRMFGIEQLQEIVDLMMEKEIRVQLPVEELDILNDS